MERSEMGGGVGSSPGPGNRFERKTVTPPRLLRTMLRIA
jgi:hypothetical protein